jgi:hypothetical protein
MLACQSTRASSTIYRFPAGIIFGHDVLQQLFVKRQIGDELLQLLVLPLELPQPLHIRWYQSAIFLAQAAAAQTQSVAR